MSLITILKRHFARLFRYTLLAAIVILYLEVNRHSRTSIYNLPMIKFGNQDMSKSRMQDGRQIQTIQTVLISKDDFLSDCRINVTLEEMWYLRSNLSLIRQNESTTLTISLSEEQQKKLKNSALARNLRNTWKKIIKYENLLKMEPIKFLPDFKSPCWYNSNHQLRCLPYFLLIGAPKAGTSDVYTMLQAHPDFRPCPEASFDNYTELIAKPIAKKLQIETVYRSKAAPKHGQERQGALEDQPMMTVARKMVTGDCSPSVMWDNHNWPLIGENTLALEPLYTNADFAYHLFNKTKIIVILRNPINRLYSNYIYFDKTKSKGPDDFHRDVIVAIRQLHQCFETYSVRTCIYLPVSDQVQLQKGIYFVHLLEWFRVFPRDQMLILRLEDYTQERTKAVQKIYNFLELRNFTYKQDIEIFTYITNGSRVYNHMPDRPGYSSDVMRLETRYILYEFYKPFNQGLARLLNDSRFDYGPC